MTLNNSLSSRLFLRICWLSHKGLIRVMEIDVRVLEFESRGCQKFMNNSGFRVFCSRSEFLTLSLTSCSLLEVLLMSLVRFSDKSWNWSESSWVRISHGLKIALSLCSGVFFLLKSRSITLSPQPISSNYQRTRKFTL